MAQKSLRPQRPARATAASDQDIERFAHGASVNNSLPSAKPKKAVTKPYSFSLTKSENDKIEALRTKGHPDIPILNRTDIVRLAIHLLEETDQKSFSESWKAYKNSEN